jgi:hypothetical protein
MSDMTELSKAYDIYDPWIAASMERDPFILTLKSGKQVQLLIPLGAAVELEKKGFNIIAGNVPTPAVNPGSQHWDEIFG